MARRRRQCCAAGGAASVGLASIYYCADAIPGSTLQCVRAADSTAAPPDSTALQCSACGGGQQDWPNFAPPGTEHQQSVADVEEVEMSPGISTLGREMPSRMLQLRCQSPALDQEQT
eukprot:SAG31_NODE_350_length_17241_cov_156.139715_4_plen_117_part_00